MASYGALTHFATIDIRYTGWHAHHIVESQDLERLCVAARFPPYEEQLCVLLPMAPHIRRVNSVLRVEAPMHTTISAGDLLQAYSAAYRLMGNYCGGGEQRIRAELMAIARAIFRRAEVI